jgi:hypothetical protein
MLISEGFTCLEANWVETVPFCSVFTFINLTANLGVPKALFYVPTPKLKIMGAVL